MPVAESRARRLLPCLPFRRRFYEELQRGAISSSELALRPDRGLLLLSDCRAERLEEHFLWLIRLGVLRREVDGQGLTERVRLTPLGRQLLTTWPEEIPPAGALTRLRGWLLRHWPRW